MHPASFLPVGTQISDPLRWGVVAAFGDIPHLDCTLHDPPACLAFRKGNRCSPLLVFAGMCSCLLTCTCSLACRLCLGLIRGLCIAPWSSIAGTPTFEMASTAQDNLGPQMRAVIWTLLGFSGLFLGLRLYCKCLKSRGLWWDDFVLVVSWVRFAGETVIVYTNC